MFDIHLTDTPAQQPQCAFVLHGLNTNPQRMTDLAQLMEGLGYKSRVGVLSGHEKTPADVSGRTVSAEVWLNDFREQWQLANEGCESEQAQRIFVGYSLGALTGMSVFDQPSEKSLKPTKMILLAPALMLRKKTLLIRSISWLPFGSLPSVNHPDYRARAWTSLKSYDALFTLHDQWRPQRWSQTQRIPTLVVLAPQDELVDSEGLDAELQQRAFTLWTRYWINNDSSKLKPRYRHLIIDQLSLGTEQWQKFTEHVGRFMSQESTK